MNSKPNIFGLFWLVNIYRTHGLFERVECSLYGEPPDIANDFLTEEIYFNRALPLMNRAYMKSIEMSFTGSRKYFYDNRHEPREYD